MEDEDARDRAETSLRYLELQAEGARLHLKELQKYAETQSEDNLFAKEDIRKAEEDLLLIEKSIESTRASLEPKN